MKIAVAVGNDGGMSSHFGRSAGFVVFGVENGAIASREVRENRHTVFAQGQCNGADAEPHAHGEAHHGHADILSLLRDCDVVICAGMGWRAATDLRDNGIQPVLTGSVMPAEEAVAAHLAGTLKSGESFCRCHE
jgi:predicted Fe-Mo cluster-binding NifX family protein